VLLLDGISLVAFSAVIDGVSSVCHRWCEFSVGWHCACCVEMNGIIFAFTSHNTHNTHIYIYVQIHVLC